ncbi:hypothetical protein BJ741DRAFT_710562 [Chytriomyces cf. hyalinus JEL632]|nr:hypothetical protein BJ741DRAFT_710562 [Chytriomyces cf. hyalinus JEL632]
MDFEFCDAPSGAHAVTYDMALRRLASFCGFSDVAAPLEAVASITGPPIPRIARSKQPAWRQPWKPTWALFRKKNKLGFLNGILTFLPDQALREEYATEFYWTFGSSRLPAPNTDEETFCLDFLFSQFMEPFKQEDRCVSWTSSMASSRCGSCSEPSTPEESPSALELNADNPKRSNFEAALKERDEMCLFCWISFSLGAALIIPPTPTSSFSLNRVYPALLNRAGLDSVYQAQNGVHLCAICHGQFHSLGIFMMHIGRICRTTPVGDKVDFDAIERHKELPVEFAIDDTSKHPNRAALAFHKTACLIWRMAGALDDRDSDYWNYDTGSVDGVEEADDDVPSPTLGGDHVHSEVIGKPAMSEPTFPSRQDAFRTKVIKMSH